MKTLQWLSGFLLAVLSASAMAQEPGSDDPCLGSTTPQINACYGARLATAEERMKHYLQAAVDRYSTAGEDAVVLGIRQSQLAFEAYRGIECGTVFEAWKGGTIRGVMELSCSIALTEQRTHALWTSWLTYADSTPPLLPEPKPGE